MEGNATLLKERAECTTLDALRAQVEGSVLTATDEAYDQARFAWNMTIDHRPTVVVDALTVADVQRAVAYAKANDLPIAVQSTGHGQPRCCTTGVLIRTTRMDAVEIDPCDHTATVQAGAKWEQVLNPAQEYGLSAQCGSAPHVGVVGYLLGGGYGLLLRKYGLGVDSILSMQVVTADGELRTASSTENPDLFWALLGGGGGFGVITEVTISLFPVGEVFGGAILYSAEMAEQVYPAYIAWTKELSNDVTSSIALVTFPPVPFVPEYLHGKSAVIISACVATGQEEAELLLKPVREIAPPIADTFRWMPYSKTAAIYNEPVDPLPAFSSGALLRDLNESDVLALLKVIGKPSESPNFRIEIRHLGGVASESNTGSCRREANYILFCLGAPLPHTPKEKVEAQVDWILQAMAP